MMNKRIFVLVLLVVFVIGSVFAGGKQETDVRRIQARFASEELEGDFMTVWAENFADEMRAWSDGAIEITVYPYGTLGDTRDINELAQIGVVEYVFSDFAWISAFVPEAQVLLLHYIWPREKIGEVLDWVARNGESMQILEGAFRRNGLVPLGIFFEGWQWLTSKQPARNLAEARNQKVRVMGSRLLVENYRSYGMAPTPMSYGEVYSGLQMGLIDAQVNPIFAIKSMNFYEVQDHFTQLYAEPFIGIPTANMQFFDSLAPEVQQKMREWWLDAIIPSAEWITERNEADLKAILAERPNITVTEVPADVAEEFQERSKAVYNTFLQEGGPDAQKVLDALLKDIDNAKAALGIN